MRTSWAGFTRAPFTCTLPPATAAAARLRVLKKRAHHSHLSRRIFCRPSCIDDFLSLGLFTHHSPANLQRQGGIAIPPSSMSARDCRPTLDALARYSQSMPPSLMSARDCRPTGLGLRPSYIDDFLSLGLFTHHSPANLQRQGGIAIPPSSMSARDCRPTLDALARYSQSMPPSLM